MLQVFFPADRDRLRVPINHTSKSLCRKIPSSGLTSANGWVCERKERGGLERCITVFYVMTGRGRWSVKSMDCAGVERWWWDRWASTFGSMDERDSNFKGAMQCFVSALKVESSCRKLGPWDGLWITARGWGVGWRSGWRGKSKRGLLFAPLMCRLYVCRRRGVLALIGKFILQTWHDISYRGWLDVWIILNNW